jgi:hypothetical protein
LSFAGLHAFDEGLNFSIELGREGLGYAVFQNDVRFDNAVPADLRAPGQGSYLRH